MRILLTVTDLNQFSSGESYTVDVSRALSARGHQVAAFSPHLGRVAMAMKTQGLIVVDDLSAVPFVPQVIYGQQSWETSLAALKWPQAGLISFRPREAAENEAPCLIPWVHKFVVVSEPGRQFIEQAGVSAARISLLPHFVDLQRFPRRPRAVSSRRALVLSNQLKRGHGLEIIEEACAAAGYSVTLLGENAGHAAEPACAELQRADVVFALGRCALEAMAVGAAVIPASATAMGPVVTPQNFSEVRGLDFGPACLADPLTVELVQTRLREVTPTNAAQVCDQVRTHASLDDGITKLEALCREAGQAARAQPVSAESAAQAALEILTAATGTLRLGHAMRALHLAHVEPAAHEPDFEETATWLRRQESEARRLRQEAFKRRDRTLQKPSVVVRPRQQWVYRMKESVEGLVATWV